MSIADFQDNLKKFKFVKSSVYENKNQNYKIKFAFILLIIKKVIYKIDSFFKNVEYEDKEMKKTGLFDREEWKRYWEEWEQKSDKKTY